MASQDLPVPELSRNMRLIGHTDQGRTVRGVSYQKGENRHFRFGPAEYLLHDRENIGQTVLVFTASNISTATTHPWIFALPQSRQKASLLSSRYARQRRP
jgi:hypothetical protein